MIIKFACILFFISTVVFFTLWVTKSESNASKVEHVERVSPAPIGEIVAGNVNKFYRLSGSDHWVHDEQYELMNDPLNNFNFIKDYAKFQTLIVDLVENNKSATFIHHGDGDYYFLTKTPKGSAKPGKRSVGKSYESLDIQPFVEGFGKNTFICLETFEPRNIELYNKLFKMKPDFPTEYLYASVFNKWFFNAFQGKIGLIGAKPKLEIIQALLQHKEYQDYLGIDMFEDYIYIPQKFACDDLEKTTSIIEEQLKTSTSNIFLVGVGHVKSGVLHRLPEFKNAVYIDVGSGIDGIAGLIDRYRPYAFGWTNYRMRDYDYSGVDMLQWVPDGTEVDI